MMLGSKALDFDACGLFRAAHSNNPADNYGTAWHCEKEGLHRFDICGVLLYLSEPG